jgi:hypothetical protein
MPKHDSSAPQPSATDNDLRVHCPRCGKRLRIPRRYAGKKCRCPHCNEPVRVVNPTAATDNVGNNPNSTPPPSSKQAHFSPSTKTPPAAHDQSESAGNTQSVNNTMPDPVTYRPNREPEPDRPSPGPSAKSVYFTLRLLLRWVVPILLSLIGLMMMPPGRGLNPVSSGSIYLFIPAFLLFRFGEPLARRLAAAWAPTFSCPGCHEVFEAVARWKCGCGFRDHKDQHFILFVCPMCDCRLGHTNCQRCESTIFLQ